MFCKQKLKFSVEEKLRPQFYNTIICLQFSQIRLKDALVFNSYLLELKYFNLRSLALNKINK